MTTIQKIMTIMTPDGRTGNVNGTMTPKISGMLDVAMVDGIDSREAELITKEIGRDGILSPDEIFVTTILSAAAHLGGDRVESIKIHNPTPSLAMSFDIEDGERSSDRGLEMRPSESDSKELTMDSSEQLDTWVQVAELLELPRQSARVGDFYPWDPRFNQPRNHKEAYRFLEDMNDNAKCLWGKPQKPSSDWHSSPTPVDPAARAKELTAARNARFKVMYEWLGAELKVPSHQLGRLSKELSEYPCDLQNVQYIVESFVECSGGFSRDVSPFDFEAKTDLGNGRYGLSDKQILLLKEIVRMSPVPPDPNEDDSYENIVRHDAMKLRVSAGDMHQIWWLMELYGDEIEDDRSYEEKDPEHNTSFTMGLPYTDLGQCLEGFIVALAMANFDTSNILEDYREARFEEDMPARKAFYEAISRARSRTKKD